MSTQLTQGIVNRVAEDHPAGKQLYDQEVAGLRIVVGSKSSSWKVMGRINDGTDRYLSIILGRTNELSLKTARERAIEIKLALRRGEDPRKPKSTVPTLAEALDRYLAGRNDLSPRTAEWYRAKVEGPLSSLARLPVDRIDRCQTALERDPG